MLFETSNVVKSSICADGMHPGTLWIIMITQVSLYDIAVMWETGWMPEWRH